MLSKLRKKLRKKLPQERSDIEGLLTWGRDIYFMDENYGFFKSKRDYAAIGIGKEFVTGYLASDWDESGDLYPVHLNMALCAAERHVSGVRKPFDFSNRYCEEEIQIAF